ncbi:GerMN domain-containing protein [Halonatronum saccharophilum]|uniref:GerMN domain-containing protein n=1 Tax=Halonatronum saccharophilum TaxID=150060 RepID=UPI000551FA11|nr:GerMN domain-containing protein [Halonatronum saccharophilum]
MNKKVYLLIIAVLLLVLIGFYFRKGGTEEVKLFFGDEGAQYLVPETREVDRDDFYANIIRELIKGPRDESLGFTIPPDTRLIDADRRDNLIVLDFTQELRAEHWGGSTGEILTIYSIVNTMTSLDGVEEVKILISGREVQTLAGHLELESPLEFNDNLVDKE